MMFESFLPTSYPSTIFQLDLDLGLNHVRILSLVLSRLPPGFKPGHSRTLGPFCHSVLGSLGFFRSSPRYRVAFVCCFLTWGLRFCVGFLRYIVQFMTVATTDSCPSPETKKTGHKPSGWHLLQTPRLP